MDRSSPGRRIRFEETQGFEPWVYAVVLGSMLLPVALILVGDPGKAGKVLPSTLGLLLPTTAIVTNLLCVRTVVDSDSVTVTFGWLFPLYRRRVPLRDIRSVEAITYSPLRDYGGWGIKGVSGNVALNARGNRGVRMTFADGKRLLIGSQKAEALARALL